MARRSLVIDSSIAVKWFSAFGEAGVEEAVDILERSGRGEVTVLVPDLLHYELANALSHKKQLSDETVQTAMSSLFTLGLQIVRANAHFLVECVTVARQSGITIYDASYVVVARNNDCPLVTANPRHQGRALGCEVVAIENWRA